MVVEPGWPFGGRPKPGRLWSLWQVGSVMHAGTINAHQIGLRPKMAKANGTYESHVANVLDLVGLDGGEQ